MSDDLDYGKFPEPFVYERISDSVTEVTMRSGFRLAPGVLITELGGVASKFANGTGVTIAHGTAVACDTATTNGVRPQTDEYDCIGFAYGDIPNGGSGWVVTCGVAEALLKNSTAATRGYWAKASATDGRIEVTTAPSGVSAIAASEHFKEVGHCLDTKSAGTDVLVRIVVHPL